LCKQILIKLVTFGENLTLSWTIRFDFVSMSIGENFVIEIDGTLL
jgi:L-ribulose-5-phosphate 3-epimerase UlaE